MQKFREFRFSNSNDEPKGGVGTKAHRSFSKLMRDFPKLFQNPSSHETINEVRECLGKFKPGYIGEFDYCGSACDYHGCTCKLTHVFINVALEAARIAIRLDQYIYALILLNAYDGQASSLQFIAEATVHKVLEFLLKNATIPPALSVLFQAVTTRARECPATSAFLAKYQSVVTHQCVSTCSSSSSSSSNGGGQ